MMAMRVIRLLYYLPMERMTDYKPQERQELEELYRKQNVRINELEKENKKLKELIMATIKMAFEDDDYDAMTYLINEWEKLGLIYVRQPWQ